MSNQDCSEPHRADNWDGTSLGPIVLAGSLRLSHSCFARPFLGEPDTPPSTDLKTVHLDRGSMPLGSLKNEGGFAQPYSFVCFPLCLRADWTCVPQDPYILGCWSP